MTTYSSAAIHKSGTLLQDRYQLDQPMAIGGTAEVWQGTDKVLGRTVAIKVLHPHLATEPDIVERFRREAIAAARLSHPNIVPTFDAGLDDNGVFIVQGLINGHPMSEFLQRKRFRPYEAAALGKQIADALEHAHNHGLIHRDIRPSNLLLVDNNCRVLITDFGIAKAVAETIDTSHTLPGITVLNPAYMSPEQLEDEEVTHKSDIYSLGVVIHEMICGHVIDNERHVADLDASLRAATNPRCEALPPALAVSLAEAIADKPDDRFENAGAFRDSLVDCMKTLDPPATQTIQRATSAVSVIHLDDDPISKTSTIDSVDYVATAAQRVEIEQAKQHIGSLWKKTLIFFGVLAFLAALLGAYLGSQLRKDDKPTPQPSSSSVELQPTRTRSFDPSGDNSENEAQIAALTDNNATTTWSSETYATRRFGNLKPGMGFVLQLEKNATPVQLEIDSPSNGWRAEVFLAPSDSNSLNAWGSSVATFTDATPGSSRITLSKVTGHALLVWFTDLGSQNRVVVNEVHVYGTPS